ncbi:MAG: AAA family ATPase [Spirochaetes bacterium]|nr:AAA family ATPase [Spirochaetota bacterium]
MNNQAEIPLYNNQNRKAKTVAVSGGKGGIGKTFFSVNFAIELKNLGFKVLIFDADVNFSNVNLMLHIDKNNKFIDFLKNQISINSIIQKGVGGVDVIYVGDDLKKILNIDDDNFDTMTEGFSEIEKEYDYIIIDTPAGLNEFILRLILNTDYLIMIANPEITALVDLYKIIKIISLQKSGVNIEIVVNKASDPENAAVIFNKIKQTISKFDIKSELSFIGFISEDTKLVIESIQKRIPIVLLHNTSNIKECFSMAVNAFLKKNKKKKKQSFFHWLFHH